MSDLRERVAKGLAAVLDQQQMPWSDGLLGLLTSAVLAILPQPPVAGDREALELAVWRVLLRHQSNPRRQLGADLIDAVGTVRPEPLPLREAALVEIEVLARRDIAQANSHANCARQALHLLWGYRWLEASLDERGDHDGPDGVTAWQRGFQAGVAEERREVLECLRQLAERSGPDHHARYAAIWDCHSAIVLRGPVRPDSLRELRQEVQQAREENEKLREVLADLLHDLRQGALPSDDELAKLSVLLEGRA